MLHKPRITIVTALVFACAPALGQISVPITSFETDRDGNALVTGNPAGYSSLQEIFFQDPSFADTTTAFILAKDDFNSVGCVGCALPEDSLEESYVDTFLGGANGTSQALLTFFSWADPTDTNRWVRVTTLQPPKFPSPSIHLGGTVRFKIQVADIGFGASNLDVAFGLLVRETGTNTALGFNGGNTGALEFVGLSNLLNASSNGPTPVPAAGKTYNGPTGWVDLVFDLSTEPVHGWTAEGGNGTLDGTRGVLEALVIMPTSSTSLDRDVFVGIDEIVFDAPVDDPAIAPRIGLPVVETATQVRVNDVLWTSTQVSLEIDRAYDGVTFVADETYSPAVANVNFTDVSGFAMLQIGDAVRANQTNSSGTSPYSTIVEVTPPPVFTVTLSLDENGDGSLAPADFEYVGASSVVGTASPQGKAVFGDCGVWQNIEFSLIPGVEPVISFAGGDGVLSPDGGLYSVDALFFSMNLIDPSVGPYTVYLDHLYIIDAADQEVVLSDAETANPFPFRRSNPPPPASFSSVLSNDASLDGVSSALIQWEFTSTDTNNALASYRLFPGFPFDDTAKALGVYLLVEGDDCSTTGPPRPQIAGPQYEAQTAVRVSGVDLAATAVSIYIDGALDQVLNSPGGTVVDVTSVGPLALGQVLNATQTTGAGESDFSLPKGVGTLPAPTISSAPLDGDTVVDVANLLTEPNATASLVTVYDAGTNSVLGTAAGGGPTASVPVSALVACDSIEVTQTVNGVESPRSPASFVGTGVDPTVVINEFVYDTDGAGGNDGNEFVELYNYGTTTINMTGWVLDHDDPFAAPNAAYNITTNATIAPGGYYVLGDSGVSPTPNQVIPNVLAEGIWENANESLQLLDECGGVIDTVKYEVNKGDWLVPGAEGRMWGNHVAETATITAIARHFDGRDTNNNGHDFSHRLRTPGSSNNPFSPVQLYTGPAVDASSIGSEVVDYWGSFVNPTVIDPTIADPNNPNAIPASPDGGNAIVTWDPLGGGNTAGSNFTINSNGAFDVWVYFDFGTNGNEQWNMGIGTPDGWAQNSLFFDANGSAGVAWNYFRTATGPSLSLVDHNETGPRSTRVTLGTADLTGLSNGWYRLAIYVCGNKVTGIFDDQVVTGLIDYSLVGTFAVGYRTDGVPLSEARPPTIDERAPTGDCQPNGVADVLDIIGGTSTDCNCNQLADECEVTASTATDCDTNGVLDVCQLAAGQSANPAQSATCAGAPYVGEGKYTGSTSGAGNDGTASCGTSDSSPTSFYRYVAGADGTLTVSLCGSGYDTVLSVYSACPADAASNGTELACNDDFCSTRSTVFVPVTAGQEVVIRVSGFNGASGDYELTLTGVSAANVALDCNLDSTLDACQLAPSAGDFTLDGLANLDDVLGFTLCADGPGVTPTTQFGACTASCVAAFDFDFDNDVDLVDYGTLMNLLE